MDSRLTSEKTKRNTHRREVCVMLCLRSTFLFNKILNSNSLNSRVVFSCKQMLGIRCWWWLFLRMGYTSNGNWNSWPSPRVETMRRQTIVRTKMLKFRFRFDFDCCLLFASVSPFCESQNDSVAWHRSCITLMACSTAIHCQLSKSLIKA